MREIVPAATAKVRLSAAAKEGVSDTDEVTFSTVLPLAWPSMRRDTGEVFVGMQWGSLSGDFNRDLASALTAAIAAEPGQPVQDVKTPTADSPRLQDLIDVESFELHLHEGFDYWVEGADLDAEGTASLDRANESVVPTKRVSEGRSAYWSLIGDRAYVRWVLSHDEDEATNALARLHARGESALGDGNRLLGCFRTSGLLVPVWEVDPDVDATEHAPAVEAMESALTAALTDEPLTPQERGARNGLINRQITLR